MPKAQKEAPDVTVKVVGTDERFLTERAFDAKFPDRKHFWRPVSEELPQGISIAKDESGNRIDNRMSMLCYMSREAWNKKQQFQSNLSLSQLRSAITNEDGKGFIDNPLTQYRNPKIVKKE